MPVSTRQNQKEKIAGTARRKDRRIYKETPQGSRESCSGAFLRCVTDHTASGSVPEASDSYGWTGSSSGTGIGAAAHIPSGPHHRNSISPSAHSHGCKVPARNPEGSWRAALPSRRSSRMPKSRRSVIRWRNSRRTMPIPLKRRTTSRMPHRMFTTVFNWSMTSESGRFPACRESGASTSSLLSSGYHREPVPSVRARRYHSRIRVSHPPGSSPCRPCRPLPTRGHRRR